MGTTTGDTLCDPGAPVILEKMDFPDPVIKIAIEPKTKGDLEKMSDGLIKLAQEDPSFRFSRDEESNQTVIEGMGELHLEILVDRLKREFNVEANVGAPQVNYRESISKESSVRYVHKKQSGGSGQFADVAIKFEPLESGSGFEFEDTIKGGVVPKEYSPGVKKGLEEMMSSGILAGFPVVDVKATLFDGSFHDVDSSVLAFQIAARGAYREGMAKAGPQLLEPIMKVEITTPEDNMGGDRGRQLPAGHRRAAGRQARRHQAGQRRGPPLGDVQLREPAAVHDQGPRQLLDEAREVRRGPEGHRRRDQRQQGERLGEAPGAARRTDSFGG